MNLRNDFKYALIEEYKTYWNAYQDPNEFYADLLSISPFFSNHFKLRKDGVRGSGTKSELKLIDQNTLWLVLYGKTKRALTCIEDIRQEELTFRCQQNRIMHSRKIIPCK